MSTLAAKGIAILFITHRLDEVLALADRVTVLRDGEIAGTPDPKQTTVVRLAELMVGRPASGVYHRRVFAAGAAPALAIEDRAATPGERCGT
jgi:simple sugar transport system ATP-binding protein